VKYLLDTHTILWFLEDSDRLSAKATKLIESDVGQNDIGVSIVSLWEFTIKQSLEKLHFDGGVANLRAMVEANEWNVLPILQSHLDVLSDLPLLHRDPFDRLLIATALTEGMTFVTADENIHGYDVKWIW
jgi:PIN domain nuclease of toxin-antitoxin system